MDKIATIELLNAQVKLDSAKIETTKALHTHEILKLALFDMLNSKNLPNSNLFIDGSLKHQITTKQHVKKLCRS